VGPLTNTERVPHEKDNHELLRFVGRTNDDQNPSLPFLGAELQKKDSNDRVISIYRPRHRKRLPIARKFSAIWGTLMVSKKN
jgi:hypothetical protein